MNRMKLGYMFGALIAASVAMAETPLDQSAGVSKMTQPAKKTNAVSPNAAFISSVTELRRGQTYTVGFEKSEGYVSGWIGGQNGWQAFPATNTARPEVVPKLTPTHTGSRHLRQRLSSTVDQGTAQGCVSPVLSPGFSPGEVCQTTVWVRITAAGGADYFVEGVDAESGRFTWRVGFDYSGQWIYIVDASATGQLGYFITGSHWEPDTYKELKVVQVLGFGGPIDYYYDGVLIYHDADGVPGLATQMNMIAIYNDNFQAGESGLFDDLDIRSIEASGACCLPNGNCEDGTSTTCATARGVFRGFGTLCGDVACPQPAACCLADGSCQDVTEAYCTFLHGAFQGEGTTCRDTQCPQPGACCLRNGACVYIPEASCSALSGTFNGESVACSAVQCPIPQDCGAGTLFAQPQVLPGQGWTFRISDSNWGYTIYDDYNIGDPIDRVRWTGLTLSWGGNGWVECVPTNPRFEIKFYPDDGGLPNVAAPAFTYVVLPTMTDGGVLFGDFHLREFDAVLSPVCTQLTGWISIQGVDLETPESCDFLWGNSLSGNSVLYRGTAEGGLDFFADDAAFCLAGPPVGACCVPASGACSLTSQEACNGTWKGAGTTCDNDRLVCKCVGDANCDGAVNFGDINPFVLALTDQAAYRTQFPNCMWINGDTNGDGTVNFVDIDPFVALLAH